MRPSILLCRGGGDAASAALFAYAEARAARHSRPMAERIAERVRSSYAEACNSFLIDSERDGAEPALRLSLEPDSLAPRFELVAAAGRSPRGTPRALRALRARAFLDARAARASAAG